MRPPIKRDKIDIEPPVVHLSRQAFTKPVQINPIVGMARFESEAQMFRRVFSIVVVLGLVLSACASSTPSASEIEAMGDEYNRDNVDAVIARFASGVDVYNLGPAGEDSTRSNLQLLAVTLDDHVSSECQPVPDSSDISCDVVFNDLFHGAGGVYMSGVERYSFDDGGLISRVSFSQGNGSGSYSLMERAFETWFADAHPNESEELTTLGSLSERRWQILLAFLDEFLEASERYP